MSWCNKWKGKYVTIDPKNPSALGQCDESGLTFNHKDLYRQMEWRGNNLVWTGFLVGKPYLDVPNEQNRPPLIKDDPKPIKNSRPPLPYTDPESPLVTQFPEILIELEDDSFFDDNASPFGPPAYVLPYSNDTIPGWQDPNPVPPYKALIAQLKKVSFQ
jgi:hypothetical protein